MNNIKGTFELVGVTSQGFSTSDLVVIGTAILSLIGVLISNFLTYQSQKKLNQKNIDADLKAKARIEWIQNVRNTTAELISLYYQLLNSTDKKILFEAFIASQAKAELLILFFGQEVQKQNQETSSLLNQESNAGKNDSIVEFLSKLTSDFYLYYSEALKNKKSTLEKIRKDRWSRMYDNPIGFVEHESTVDDDGNEWSNREPIWDSNLKADLSEIEKQIQEYTLFTKNLNDSLIYLRNVMRIYLKIEWNKAKNGQ